MRIAGIARRKEPHSSPPPESSAVQPRGERGRISAAAIEMAIRLAGSELEELGRGAGLGWREEDDDAAGRRGQQGSPGKQDADVVHPAGTARIEQDRRGQEQEGERAPIEGSARIGQAGAG